jgi:hypothetical protein
MQIKTLKTTDLLKCPHVILVPEHYRDDGSCKCNDPAEKIMAEWGYVWSDKAREWVNPEYKG